MRRRRVGSELEGKDEEDEDLLRDRPQFWLTMRSVTGDLRATIAWEAPTVSLLDLQRAALDEFGWPEARIVHQGRVLGVLDSIDIVSNSSVFLVVPKRPYQQNLAQQHSSLNLQGNATPTGEEPPENPFESNDTPRNAPERNTGTANRDSGIQESRSSDTNKTCRICFQDQEEDGFWQSRLISPCLCRGTMQYVHIECLNQWRLNSPSSSAFYKCPQCGFKYLFARTKVAKYIEFAASDHVCTFVAAIVLIIAVHITAHILHATGTHEVVLDRMSQPLRRATHRYLGRYKEFIEFHLAGLAVVSATGAFVHLARLIDQQYWRIRQHVDLSAFFFENPNVLFIGASLATHTNETFSRTMFTVGILFCAHTAFMAIKSATLLLLQRFGEKILEPTKSTTNED
mmetsp:Transcript_2217/g.5118  ORF Transcript_2217/g.5118 Transcript_2217/m.5118 type:complete len:400 (-) Transcript_2217:4150-5349(-)